MARLPDDMWQTIADYASHPALVRVARRWFRLLRGAHLRGPVRLRTLSPRQTPLLTARTLCVDATDAHETAVVASVGLCIHAVDREWTAASTAVMVLAITEGRWSALRTLELDLLSNSLGDTGAAILGTALGRPGACPCLETLRVNLSANGIRDVGCAVFVHATLGAAAALPALTAYDVDLADNEIAVGGCTAIRDAMRARFAAPAVPPLRCLRLGLAQNAIRAGDACRALGAAVFRPAAPGGGKFQWIDVALDLRANNMGGMGLVDLVGNDVLDGPSAAVVNCASIDVSENAVTHVGVAALCARVLSGPWARAADLSVAVAYNPLGGMGVRALCGGDAERSWPLLPRRRLAIDVRATQCDPCGAMAVALLCHSIGDRQGSPGVHRRGPREALEVQLGYNSDVIVSCANPDSEPYHRYYGWVWPPRFVPGVGPRRVVLGLEGGCTWMHLPMIGVTHDAGVLDGLCEVEVLELHLGPTTAATGADALPPHVPPCVRDFTLRATNAENVAWLHPYPAAQRLLREPTNPVLRRLCLLLDHTGVAGDAVCASVAIAGAASLTELNLGLRHTGVTDAGLAALLAPRWPALNALTIDVGHNADGVTCHGMDAVSKAFLDRDRTPALAGGRVVLRFDECATGYHHQHLERADRHLHPPDEAAAAGRMAAAAVSIASTCVLGMRAVHMTTTGAIVLANAIREARTLRHLCLDVAENGLTHYAVRNLVHNLRLNRSLVDCQLDVGPVAFVTSGGASASSALTMAMLRGLQADGRFRCTVHLLD